MSDLNVIEPEVANGPFSGLLRSVGWNEFFASHWGHRSLHIRGCQEQLQTLPGFAELPQLLAGKLNPEGWQQGLHLPQGTFIDRRGQVRGMATPPGTWAQAYNAGLSLCFGGIDHWDEGLKELVADCRRSTRVSGEVYVTAYLAPKGSGSTMHFDCQHVFFLQVSGDKHWRIGKRAALQAPPLNFHHGDVEAVERLRALGLAIDPPEACEMEELVLRQGEVLYLPPGFWHEARTEESASLHYTLTVHAISFGVLANMQLRTQLFTDPAWRCDLRALTPEARLAFLGERLAELRALLDSVTPSSLMQVYDKTDALPPSLKFALALVAL